MKTYEALIILPSQFTVEGHQDPKHVFEELIKKHNGKVLNRTELGKRLLGYSVKKAKEGYVVSFVFELPPEKVDSFKRSLQLAEEILKFTIVVKSKDKLARAAKALGQTAHAGEKR